MTTASWTDLGHIQRAFQLSAEEAQKLAAFDELLVETAQHTNLIARASLGDRWERHYADSAQLFDLLPATSQRLIDIGSGAGFPGIVLAIMAEQRLPQLRLQLVDSVGKKARFLQTVISELPLGNCHSSSQRAEVFHVKHPPYDVVTARAVTALDKLLDLAVPLMSDDGLLIFPKGERAQEELTKAAATWTFDLETRPSLTHSGAQILMIRKPERRS
ncbi:16S rRNA (guanine(527)-N(7))-methyltransferase RsmG [Parvularcula sp. LCG005]|uniref:16S rRNA (guanine(527)-N(7))-methyltransferase RsmG n=1 Tax=Parvularcula sp. LCG005 TaxID=3078805 RepID=UPI002942734D|nr:16S rRNA (guanine(527)-N(7))-methyltransferase RsmG [Parvularcula sp. LCG005]WOI53303.1 16S rRNA (guanine(527)-N(7))-methyltransferase RsmG [Parvularcula sp. LCG005]